MLLTLHFPFPAIFWELKFPSLGVFGAAFPSLVAMDKILLRYYSKCFNMPFPGNILSNNMETGHYLLGCRSW